MPPTTIRNPRAKWWQVLGLTDGQWTAARVALEAHLDANANAQTLDEATARATSAVFANAGVWAQTKAELGL